MILQQITFNIKIGITSNIERDKSSAQSLADAPKYVPKVRSPQGEYKCGSQLPKQSHFNKEVSIPLFF